MIIRHNKYIHNILNGYSIFLLFFSDSRSKKINEKIDRSMIENWNTYSLKAFLFFINIKCAIIVFVSIWQKSYLGYF